MDQNEKRYEAMKADSRVSVQSAKEHISLQDGMYYEIEYDATPMPGVGKFVLKTEKLETPERDEVRERFDRMRDIARRNRIFVSGSSKFYSRKVQQERSRIFYKQGRFMSDFEDSFEETAPYSEYFPCYQMMGYKQLRTYFTWRTKVRQGKVEDTSLSYAYLYLYELLNNIGVSNHQEGLDKLLFFWREFRVYQPAVDNHVPKWLKDYHIYYELGQTFPEFVAENELEDWYPELAEAEDKFSLYCGLSKYDIRKSKFYIEDREALIQDCFRFTFKRLTTIFEEHGILLEDMIFAKSKPMALWMPFQDALFYPWLAQGARQVALSPGEIYMCTQSQWYYQVPIALDSGRQFLGYLLKQMEVVLRQKTKYKYKITVDINAVPSAVTQKLEAAGISLEQSITETVTEFYREATRTVVSVDRAALEKIRLEALQTQEKLLVPEEETLTAPVQMSLFQTPVSDLSDVDAEQMTEHLSAASERDAAPAIVVSERELATLEQAVMALCTTTAQKSAPLMFSEQAVLEKPLSAEKDSETEDPWTELRAALSQTQLEAVRLALTGETNMKEFADANGVMLEVLADGINEKAVDIVGDSLLDEEFMVYDDYAEQVREILGE